ncbi:MAG: hypothetical protein B1H11_06645 [Desulfobacteraceae bacterium 4484_190.1]|nr:MAG: hypothetical protein B1H11_06645 [Desulfobacteraceae bacterium 4484_190.1]
MNTHNNIKKSGLKGPLFLCRLKMLSAIIHNNIQSNYDKRALSPQFEESQSCHIQIGNLKKGHTQSMPDTIQKSYTNF